MALSEQEKALGRQIKTQGGTKDDFREALQEFRKRQSIPTQVTQESTQTPQVVETPEQMEAEEGVKGFATETVEALGARAENIGEIQERLTDKSVKNFSEIRKLNQEGKPLAALLESAKGSLNKLGSSVQVAGQIAGGVGDIIWEGIENSIQEFTPEKAEQAIENTLMSVVDSGAGKAVAESYLEFREKNPETARNLEAIGNIGGLLGSFIKSGGAAARSAKSAEVTKEGERAVEAFIKPTKEKTKQATQKITPDLLEKLRTGQIEPGTRQEIQALAQARAESFGQQITEAVDSGLEGNVNRDDLLNILDDLKNEGVVDGRVVDEEIVTATDKMADIISNFPNEIPADKARELRQVFDSAVFKTKGLVSEEALSLKNTIKKKLADNIRKQLAEQNPNLAKLNQEFSFYTNLDDVLSETIRRAAGQSEGGGIETKRSALLRTLGGGTGAGIGTTIGGTQGGFIGGAIGVAAANKLDEIMASSKYKIIDAQKKAKLAEDIVNRNKQKVKEALNDMAKKVGIAELPDEDQE